MWNNWNSHTQLIGRHSGAATLGNSRAISFQVKLTMWFCHPTPRYLPMRSENACPHKDVCVKVHRSFIYHNHPKVEAANGGGGGGGLVTKSCPPLSDPTGCNPSGSSVHGISQARILEWVPISFSRGSSWTRDRTSVSSNGRGILYHWATRSPQSTPDG